MFGPFRRINFNWKASCCMMFMLTSQIILKLDRLAKALDCDFEERRKLCSGAFLILTAVSMVGYWCVDQFRYENDAISISTFSGSLFGEVIISSIISLEEALLKGEDDAQLNTI